MAGFDGSGGWAAPAGFPVSTGNTISSTAENLMNSTVETSFETCMTLDGQTVPTANIPMGGFRLTGLGNASAVTDAARVSQVQNGSYHLLSSVGGTANAITATVSPTPAAIATGQLFKFYPAATNTGAATINISSLGAYPIRLDGTALSGSELMINKLVYLEADASASCMHIAGGSYTQPFSDDQVVVRGKTDPTKRIRFEVDGLTANSTRVLTIADRDFAPGKSPTRTVLTATSSSTYTTPTGCTWFNVRMVGGGGGGGGASANNGVSGENTTFDTLVASGGVGGTTNSGAGGGGGTGTNGDINITGGSGGGGNAPGAAVNTQGGNGGNSVFGGGAGISQFNAAGVSAGANSGGGGSGAGATGGNSSAGGGGAGGYCEKLFTSPAATYGYKVGAGGAGGAAGTLAGGNGARGIIIVDEHYD